MNNFTFFVTSKIFKIIILCLSLSKTTIWSMFTKSKLIGCLDLWNSFLLTLNCQILGQAKLCHHPPPFTTIHHHLPPSITTHHQPKYIHHHPPPPSTRQNASPLPTTTYHQPKYIHRYLSLPKKLTTTLQKPKYIHI